MDLSALREFVFDIDGCLAVGPNPVPGAVDALRTLHRAGFRFVLFTNDSLLPPEQWQARVRAMGFDLPDLRVMTAGELAAALVAERYPGGRAFVLGTEAMTEEVRKRGITVVDLDRAQEADVVLVARAPSFTYADLTAGLRALLKGAALVTTSMARTIPTPDGPVPGTGALTTALAYASRVEPVVAGKPSLLAAQTCLRLAGFEPARCAFVGDDPELDHSAARALGAFSILVLTGTTGRADVARLPETLRPDLVLDSVADLPRALSL